MFFIYEFAPSEILRMFDPNQKLKNDEKDGFSSASLRRQCVWAGV